MGVTRSEDSVNAQTVKLSIYYSQMIQIQIILC